MSETDEDEEYPSAEDEEEKFEEDSPAPVVALDTLSAIRGISSELDDLSAHLSKVFTHFGSTPSEQPFVALDSPIFESSRHALTAQKIDRYFALPSP
jgi:hypothetical protein